MSSKDPPEVIELFEAIESLLPKAIELEGVIVRSAGTKYANEDDFLSGEGAGRFGGRWNPIGLKAIYGSTDIITATIEANQNFIDAGFSLSSLRPRVTAGAHVTVERLLDLTDVSVRRKLGFSKTELMEEDWMAIQRGGEESWTQAIGRGCFEMGFEGLIAHSARNPDGKNVVLFPELITAGKIVILGQDELPPHPDSWPAK